MDAIDRFVTIWDREGKAVKAAYECDPRKIQLAILEEMTLMRKAWEQVAAGKERLLDAVEGDWCP